MSRDNSYIRRDTAEGQRDIATHSDISKELQELSCMNFDGALYGLIDRKSEFELQNYEVDAFISFGATSAMYLCSLDDAVSDGFSVEVDTYSNLAIWENGVKTNNTYVPTFSTGTFYKLTYKRYNDHSYVYVNDILINDYASSTITYTGLNGFSIGSILWSSVQYPSVTKTIPYFNFYELDASGNRTAHLIKLTGAETAGNIWHNTAEDAPAGSDAVVNLNGASDGDQFTTSIYASDHNQRYGRRQVGGFDGNLYFTSQAAPSNPIEEVEFWFYTPRTWIGEDSPREGIFAFDTTQSTSMAVFGTISGVLAGETFSYLQGNTYRAGITDQIDTGFNQIKMVYDASFSNGQYRVYLNGIEKSIIGNTVSVNIQYNLNNPVIGASKLSGTIRDEYSGFIYKVLTSGSGWNIEWDFTNYNPDTGVVPNTGADAPANSDAVLNLNGSYSGRERVFIPQKTGLLDAYGQPIDNKEQVTRFKRSI